MNDITITGISNNAPTPFNTFNASLIIINANIVIIFIKTNYNL